MLRELAAVEAMALLLSLLCPPQREMNCGEGPHLRKREMHLLLTRTTYQMLAMHKQLLVDAPSERGRFVSLWLVTCPLTSVVHA